MNLVCPILTPRLPSSAPCTIASMPHVYISAHKNTHSLTEGLLGAMTFQKLLFLLLTTSMETLITPVLCQS